MIQRLLNDDLKETVAKEKKQVEEEPGTVTSLLYALFFSTTVFINAEQKCIQFNIFYLIQQGLYKPLK
jgi:hypothetical protein